MKEIIKMAMLMVIALVLVYVVSQCKGGDTYDCIRANGDHVAYGPALVRSYEIVVAEDSARHEMRWQPMLDPDDLRALIFEGARHTQILEVH